MAETMLQVNIVNREDDVRSLLVMFDLSHAGQKETERLQSLITANASIFSVGKSDPGLYEAIKRRIPTAQAAPVYRRGYRTPFSKSAEMKEQVDAC